MSIFHKLLTIPEFPETNNLQLASSTIIIPNTELIPGTYDTVLLVRSIRAFVIPLTMKRDRRVDMMRVGKLMCT